MENSTLTNHSTTTVTSTASYFFENVKGFLASVSDFLVFIFSLKITWQIIAGIAIICACYRLWLQYKKKRVGLISYKLSQEIKKAPNREKTAFLSDWLEQLYIPSWPSVITVFGVAVILFVVSHISEIAILYKPLDYLTSNHYQNLIAIHAGIGAIIFALLIFIAESLRDEDNQDRARVLLRESFLFPLTVAEIIGFFVFVWGDLNIWALLSPIIMAILTITSLWKLLSVLLSKSKFSKKRLQLLKDRVKRSIDLAIRERFGNTILLQSLGEKKIELQYYPFSLDSDLKLSHHCFYTDKTGVITDIRLNKLDEFAKIVEKEANKNNLSFYKSKAKPLSGKPSSNGSVKEAAVEKFPQLDKQYLNKKFRDDIDEENQLLISVDKKTVKDEEVIRKLGKLAKEIFVIRKQDNFSEEIKLEIDGLKDQFIQAIEEKKLGKVEELSRTYLGLAEAFLEAITPHGGGYSYQQARKERGLIFEGWNEIRWLSDSIREILVKAAQSHDEETIRDVAYLPVSIAIKAIKFGDQLVYQEFLKFPSFLYWLALKETDQDVKKFMVDRSWRHLKEMSDFYVENQLKRKANDVDTIKKYDEFTIPIFFAFQNLLKTAFDKSDFESFGEFLTQFQKLYRDFEPPQGYSEADHLRYDLNRVSDPTAKENISKKIMFIEAREKAAEGIQQRKQQVIFGLTAWIFGKHRNTPANADFLRFYNEISSRLPKDLPQLTKLFISARTFETESFWDWDGWEMIADGEVHMIDFHSKLDRLYCVRALLILKDLSPDAIGDIVLPHSRDFAFLAEDRVGSNTLSSILNDISAHPESWSIVLPPEAIAKVADLKLLLIKAKEAQEKEEEKFLETVEINSEKLKEFKSKIVECFYESVTLRPIFTRLQTYKDLTKQKSKEGLAAWGYNQLDKKDAFIKDWYVHYGGWGENYGRGMASSENELIFKQMLKEVTVRKDIVKTDSLREIEKVITEKDIKDPIIIETCDHFFEYNQLQPSGKFISRYQNCPKTKLNDIHGFKGVLKIGEKTIPIVSLFVREGKLKNKILVCGLKTFGELIQYSPIDKEDDESYKEDIFFLKVTDLNKDNDRRIKIISENSVWLQSYPDKESYLKRQVLINLYQKFEFQVKDPNSAYLLSISDMSASDDGDE